mgnify:CR=1 FL=1
MDKTVRVCNECAELLKDGFALQKINVLRVIGKCDMCGEQSELRAYTVKSKKRLKHE